MFESGGLQISSMRARCSETEWQARVDLAACYRLVELYGMSDMMANHISARVPGEPDAFLINAYGMLYEEITASSLIKVDHDGKIISAPDFDSSTMASIRRASSFIAPFTPRARTLTASFTCIPQRR